MLIFSDNSESGAITEANLESFVCGTDVCFVYGTNVWELIDS